MKIFWLFALGMVFFGNFCMSAPEDCPDERRRLRAQVRSLEQRVGQQQLQVEQLRSQRQYRAADHSPNPPGQTDFADCAQVFNAGNRRSGFYRIKPLRSPSEFLVYCDMSEGGGWAVVQRRTDGSESFNRPWKDYKEGFGNTLSADGEFWLGNDKLHSLTSQGNYNLRINMIDFEGDQRFAIYRNFKVGDEQSSYRLSFGEYSGTAGDSLSGRYHPEVQWWAGHNGMNFSTYDRDNDRYEGSCAQEDTAGWWFNRCHSVNLNGYYYKGPYTAVSDNGIIWYTWHGWWYSIRSVVMKIRPAEFEPNEV
ncbi:FGL1 protein, partial [Atractosteus spatula]|nr:FGL1 protein [Atractosteus spatula]